MSESETKDGKLASSTAPTLARQTVAPVSVPDLTPTVDAESFGRALAAARKARGLSAGDVAAELRLQLRQVRAIEAEDLGALPEGPFVRGFVRNYAKLVGLPPEPLLTLLAVQLKPPEPLRADRAGAGVVSPVQMAAREHASRFTVVGGSVALLLLFAVLGWWTMRPVAPPPAPAPSAAAPAPAPTETAAQAPATVETAAAPPAESVPAEPASSAGDGIPVSATVLRFTFRDRSWVEVTQADGTVLMSRNNAAGAQETIDGAPPYTLVIGNASKVDLEFGGTTVDLGAHASRDNVARLRLP